MSSVQSDSTRIRVVRVTARNVLLGTTDLLLLPAVVSSVTLASLIIRRFVSLNNLTKVITDY